MLTAKLIISYVFWAFRFGVFPWRFFQINAKYFDKNKGYFSKSYINDLIPEQWRLQQTIVAKDKIPQEFPVFIKPEWGQNANGIVKIDNVEDYLDCAKKKVKVALIVQECALEKIEFEIFCVRSNTDLSQFSVLSITQVSNTSKEFNPINYVNNPQIIYTDITQLFTEQELEQLKKLLRQFPEFRMARFALMSNSKGCLLKGLFHVIEINLFAPLPINLLDRDVTKKEKNQFIKKCTQALVKVSAGAPRKHFHVLLFPQIVRRHFQTK